MARLGAATCAFGLVLHKFCTLNFTRGNPTWLCQLGCSCPRGGRTTRSRGIAACQIVALNPGVRRVAYGRASGAAVLLPLRWIIPCHPSYGALPRDMHCFGCRSTLRNTAWRACCSARNAPEPGSPHPAGRPLKPCRGTRCLIRMWQRWSAGGRAPCAEAVNPCARLPKLELPTKVYPQAVCEFSDVILQASNH